MHMTTPRFMAPLERQRETYVNPHVHPPTNRTTTAPVVSVTAATNSMGVQRGSAFVTIKKPTPSSSSGTGVVVPSRTFPADSAEARLMSLMQQHHAHGTSLWPTRLEALEHQVHRVQFLDSPEEHFLRLVVERSKRYLRNIEEMMTEASSSLIAVDSGVLRTVSSSWEAAKGLVARAERILDEGYAKNLITSPSAPTTRQLTSSLQVVASNVSPVAALQSIQLPQRRSTTPRPLSSSVHRQQESISSPTRRSTPPPSRGSPSVVAHRSRGSSLHRPGEVPTAQRNNSHVALSARKDLLETIEAIGFGCLVAGELTGDAMAEAKQCFALLYGTSDGHRRFLKWCDEQTLHLSRCQSF